MKNEAQKSIYIGFDYMQGNINKNFQATPSKSNLWSTKIFTMASPQL